MRSPRTCLSTMARPLAAIFCLAAVVSLLTAQSTPTKNGPEDRSSVVQLSPFLVTDTQATGYRSTNSSSITRLDASVQDLPVTVQIFNPELLKDLATTNLMDLGRFIVGGTDHASAGIWFFDLRGFNSAINDDTQRNGFRYAGRPNLYNVDRIEVILGPNSVIQGAADPGGQVNVITKSALIGQRFATLSAKLGSFGARRAALDANYSVPHGGNNFALRINAVTEEAPTFIKFSQDDSAGIAIAAKEEFGRNTTLDAKFEYLRDSRVPWSNLMDRWSGGPGLTGGLHMGLNRQVPRLYNYDEANATTGPDSREKRAGTYFEASLTHRFSDDLHFQLVGQSGHEAQPLNLYGGQNPTVGYNASSDSYYVNRAWAFTQSDDKRYNVRAVLNYNLHLGWTEQKIIVGYSLMHVEVRGGSDTLVNSATNAAIVEQTPIFPGAVTAERYRLDMTGRAWKANAATGNDVRAPSYYVNSTGSYFNGKLKTVLGYSWNTSDRTDYIYATPTSGSFLEGTAARGNYLQTTKANTTANIPMASIVYSPTPSLSLYANYSKSFKPQNGYFPTLDLTTGAITGSLGPVTGEGHEVGVKFDVSKANGLSGSVAFYKVAQQNVSQVLDNAVVAQLLGQAAALAQRYYVGGVEQTGKGVEVQLYYNPNPSISVIANYAYNDSEITKSQLIPALVGTEANVHMKHMANVIAKYTWTGGAMKGLFLGGKSTIRSKMWRVQNTEFGYNPGFVVFGGFIGYAGKSGRSPFSIQANVDNIADKIYLRSYALVGEPRQYSVSGSWQF